MGKLNIMLWFCVDHPDYFCRSGYIDPLKSALMKLATDFIILPFDCSDDISFVPDPIFPNAAIMWIEKTERIDPDGMDRLRMALKKFRDNYPAVFINHALFFEKEGT